MSPEILCFVSTGQKQIAGMESTRYILYCRKKILKVFPKIFNDSLREHLPDMGQMPDFAPCPVIHRQFLFFFVTFGQTA